MSQNFNYEQNCAINSHGNKLLNIIKFQSEWESDLKAFERENGMKGITRRIKEECRHVEKEKFTKR